MKTKNIYEAFKEFCKRKHAENKGKNYNLLQEIYSRAEFFDLSFLDFTSKRIDLYADFEKNRMKVTTEELKNYSLPFEVNFVQLYCEEVYRSYVFTREFAPNICTGVLVLEFVDKGDTVKIMDTTFTLHTETGTLIADRITDEKSIKMALLSIKYANPKNFGESEEKYRERIISILEKTMQDTEAGSLSHIFLALKYLGNLPKSKVVSDIPNKTEYYPRKGASTIKVVNRPLYYVLGDKKERELSELRTIIRPIGKLEYTHSFKVRGHWRKLDSKSYGKDRNGNYNVTGFTWVTEHVRGEGELVKRVRVLK